MVLVMLGWALFYFENMDDLGAFLLRLFTYSEMSASAVNIVLAYLPLLLVCLFASTPVMKSVAERYEDLFLVRYGKIVAVGGVFLLCVASLASQSYNPFIYFRF